MSAPISSARVSAMQGANAPGAREWGTRVGHASGDPCSGTLVLACAGLLDHRRAAANWKYHDAIDERFARVALRRSEFGADPRRPTASGATATAGLMLHLIVSAHGPDFVAAIAARMIYNALRDGAAAQRMSVEARHGVHNVPVAAAVRLMRETLDECSTPTAIADEIGISTRQLERLFRTDLKVSSNRYATTRRLEQGRNLQLQTELSGAQIALARGNGLATHFLRAFPAHYGGAATAACGLPGHLPKDPTAAGDSGAPDGLTRA